MRLSEIFLEARSARLCHACTEAWYGGLNITADF